MTVYDIENNPNEKVLPSGVYRSKIPYFRMLIDQGAITQNVLHFDYPGSGTEEDPYVVSWISNDSRNPQLFSFARKLTITLVVAFSTMVVALTSSTYSGSVGSIVTSFDVSTEVATLGLSLFVLGFAVGPLLWAPISEVFGRQRPFFVSFLVMAAFSAGCAGAQNIWSLLILRFFAGAFGSAPLTNAGGTISDMFTARQRGLALSLYAAAPFLGPALGPIIGGFLSMNAGWRWVEGLLAASGGLVWIMMAFAVPETYAPLLLRQRAERLSQVTGKVYRSKIELEKGKVALNTLLRRSLSRPLVLLFTEPIVLLFAVYIAIIYGTLYMFFAGFPIVYEQGRGWNPGVGGLAFLGIMIGMIIGIIFTLPANMHFIKIQDRLGGFAPPEARLLQCMVGAVAIPISQFWFAWTDYPSIHWIVSIIGTAPFGFGVILIYLGVMNYLIDSYTIYAASVLAANTILRSIFGAVFPLITGYIYDGVGIHWGPSIPAFLSLLCTPAPFLFYRYGADIRKRCRYSAESFHYMQKLQENATNSANTQTKQPAVQANEYSSSETK
ncbi:major facilitator superfamily domain-containing protein [Aspergillus pseudonomiae]|uniref:Major facilitator superfamily domain-containing protein n=1 Tax=Aspergillus pseudonomiae TaxID=1506151 RepID=A0A5N7DS29_9EURO|nr:major facilitator superfamily domain-containing protein [Aspergillus pseudonomiae]KAB8264417.1 major facilitator superfamily domain-containing protein [Aspergillus pseudonomiae]KAE8409270.1 major facilitator superfamily domain-containing protein [Aspergillus pseudonomiae]